MYRKQYNKKLSLRKCGLFPWDSIIEGASNIAATSYAANKQYEGTKYAADQSYNGQVATNRMNQLITADTNLANRQIADAANQANIFLANQQNQWNLEQWNRQNAYNSPANQMKLYRQAGLNPALAQGQFSSATPLQSADLANQQVGNPMQASHMENPNALSSDIMARGAMQRAEFTKNLIKDSVDVMKAGSELIEQKVKNGFLPDLLKSEVKKNGAEIANIAANTKRINDLLPYEINDYFAKYCTMKAQEYKYKGDAWYVREMAQAQKNINSLWDKTRDALGAMPAAKLNEINQHAAVLAEQSEMLERSNQFTKMHGYDMSTYASVYGANMGFAASKYSSDKSYDLGMSGISADLKKFNAKQKQDWRQFSYEVKLQKYLQKQKNLNSLQVAGIMAGASMANSIMNNLTFGIDSKRRNQLGRMQFEASMKRYEKNPADTYMNYFQTYGTFPNNFH